MPQSLHIFRKDLLHLWPETLVSLILFVAFAWSAPSHWTQTSDVAPYVAILAALLKVLMPISWLVVISRLIHDESLVGDRQFWTSRPYHWGWLLLAKILYLLVFLYLPFFLMQVYLLLHAGLHPTTALPALFYNLFLLTVLIIVPLTALAAVTSTFARLLLTTLGAIIYILILFAVVLFSTLLERMSPPHMGNVVNTLFILIPAAVLVYQYATRRTLTSRIALAATPLLLAILVLITPANALIRHAYPVLSGSSAPALTSIPVPSNTPVQPGRLMIQRDNMHFRLPFKVEGIDNENNYVVDGLAYTLTGAGAHYTSPYRPAFLGLQQINAAPYTVFDLALPVPIFNQVHSVPVDIHLSVAADHLKAGKPSTWTASAGGFDVPGHGHCTFSADDSTQSPTCRFPLATPVLLFVTAPVSMGCGTGAQPTPARTRIGSQTSSLDFDPVITVPLNLSPAGEADPQAQYTLCPGTKMDFTQALDEGKVRLELEDKQVVLDPLAARINPNPARSPGMGRQQLQR